MLFKFDSTNVNHATKKEPKCHMMISLFSGHIYAQILCKWYQIGHRAEKDENLTF